MKIAMLTTIRFHQSKGGAEKVMIDMANAMVERGHSVLIIYRDKSGDDPGFFLNKKVVKINCAKNRTPLMLSGVMRYIRSASISKDGYLRNNALLKLKALAKRFGPALKKFDADLYITYEPKLSAMLVHEFHVSKPIITTFQYAPSYIMNRVDSKWILPLIGLRKNEVVQVLENEYVDEVRKGMPWVNNVRVIPNAVTGVHERSELKNKIIINVGRVVWQKNQLLVVKAFNEVKDRFPDWKLEIWGELSQESDVQKTIEQFIRANNLENRVFLKGGTNDVAEKLRYSSIFAFPSVVEGLPLALIEAMSSGLPCVGLDSCKGVNSLLRKNENGFLCTSDHHDWARILELLMRDYSLRLRLGEQAAQDAKNFQPDRIWKQWDKLLNEMVSENTLKE